MGRGGGRACVANHKNGCRHYGVLDLNEMDQKTYLFYLKDGGWLTNKSCTGCNLSTKEICVDKITKTVVRYCEMGLKSIKFVENGPHENKIFFDDHDCDMILCISCWNKKVLFHEQQVVEETGIVSRRVSARKKL